MRHVFAIILCIFFLAGCKQLTIPEQPYLLVTHIKEGIISFLDLENYDVISEEPFPYEVHTIVNIDKDVIAFTGKLEEFVRTLNLRTGEIDELYEFGQGILAMAFDEERKMLFLADAKTDSILFFDFEQKKIVAKVAIGSYPTSLVMNDDKTEIYALASDDSEIYVIDIETKQVLRTIPTKIGSTTLLFDGKYLWVGGHGMYRDLNEFIYLYDPETGEEVKKITVGSMPIFFYEEKDLGDIVVLCHGSHELYVVDPKTYQVKTKLSVGENPYYATSNEHYLFVTGLDSHDVSVIDKETFQVVQTVNVKNGPYAMTIGGSSVE